MHRARSSKPSQPILYSLLKAGSFIPAADAVFKLSVEKVGNKRFKYDHTYYEEEKERAEGAPKDEKVELGAA